MVMFAKYNGTNVYPSLTHATLAHAAQGLDVWKIDMAMPFAGFSLIVEF